MIGVSAGDHTHFQFSVLNQQGSMASASDILFTPTLTNLGLPFGLTLGTNGLITGTPFLIGTNVIQIAAYDQYDQATNAFSLAVLRAYAPLGTPLDWLAAHGLTNRAWSAVELADDDGDGVPNWQEYVADTDPTNAGSVFKVLAISNLPPWTIYFDASAARVYTLERGNNPTGFVAIGATNIPGLNGLMALPAYPAGTQQFYRVRVQLPP